MARSTTGLGKHTMSTSLSKVEAALLIGLVLALVGISSWQQRQLQRVQLNQKKALYAERIRTAQTILENEMLKAAFFVTTDTHTQKRARSYLEQQPQ